MLYHLPKTEGLISKMRELGERIATGAVDKEGNPLIKPKENMGKKPGDVEL